MVFAPFCCLNLLTAARLQRMYALWILLFGATWTIRAQTLCTKVGPPSTIDTEIRHVFLGGDNFSIGNLIGCPAVTGLRYFTQIDFADLSLSAL